MQDIIREMLIVIALDRMDDRAYGLT